MKEQNFENYDVFKNEVENLKRKHEYFFADAEKLTIYRRKRNNQPFLDFYLNILVMVTEYRENELTSYTTTHFYFYLSKSFILYPKKDLKIMLDKLGYNYDDYEQQFTDKVGVFY